jgi:hypothetical protein
VTKTSWEEEVEGEEDDYKNNMRMPEKKYGKRLPL